jgi:hypothetical protein
MSTTARAGDILEFPAALSAPGRSPEIPEASDIYGFLVGSWELDVRYYWVDVSSRGLKGEVHAGRTLEGRAIQDVWIMPRRADRTAGIDPKANMYGTTLRIWDAALQAWRIHWFNPVTGQRDEQIGRKVGHDIIQIGSGTKTEGTASRWRFTEITPDSFHWIGEALAPDGKTWVLGGEFLATRLR